MVPEYTPAELDEMEADLELEILADPDLTDEERHSIICDS